MLIEESIEIITKMFIEEHINGTDKEKYVITKEELYKFCIKLLKEIEKVRNET